MRVACDFHSLCTNTHALLRSCPVTAGAWPLPATAQDREPTPGKNLLSETLKQVAAK